MKTIGPTGSARSQCSWEASNFGRSLFLRPNSVSDVLGLYGKPCESRIHPYIYIEEIRTHIRSIKYEKQ